MNRLEHNITIITATFNSESNIGLLIASLESQIDKNFKWIIVDAESTDNTVQLVKNSTLDITIISEIDFGIYDALNKAIRLIQEGYYLVIGSDDTFSPDAIYNYRESLKRNPNIDFIAASIKIGKKIRTPKKGLGWLYGISGVASGHSIGLLINIDLHRNYGYYSNKFPIAADQLFIKTCLNDNAKIQRELFIAGEFTLNGVSSVDTVGLLTEFFRVQILTEKYHFIQLILFTLRLWKLFIYRIFFRKSL